MRIGWVTPLSDRSAIGRVSSAVCRMLAEQGHEVSIIRSEHRREAADSPDEGNLRISWWQDTDPDWLMNNCDAVVVNIGDNFPFHAGIFRYLAAGPCVGIFHDFFLYSLFNDWLAGQPHAEQLYAQIIKTHYGDAVLDLANSARGGTIPFAQIADRMPMTEWIAAQCGAAIVHAEFYRKRVEIVPGPVRAIRLSQHPRKVRPLAARSGNDVVLLTVGVINPNKRVDLVLEAIGSSPQLRSRCQYRLAGVIGENERLELTRLADRVGFSGLEILGPINNEELERELESSDVICCLRNPVLEGASASAIEAMMCGRPVVVSNAGFYAELPDDCVAKVPINVEPLALAGVLKELIGDETKRRQLGERARKYSHSAFTTAGYVAELVSCLDEFVECKPYLHVGRSIGNELALLDLPPSDPAIDGIAACMAELFLEGAPVETKQPKA